MWDDLPPDVTLHQKFERRHTELEGIYWKDMVEKGALVSKYTGSKTSVLEMVDMLINTKMTPPLLTMQKEGSGSSVRRRLGKRLKEGDTEGDFEGKDGAAERLDLQERLESIESELALLRVALPFEKSELHDVARQDENIWDFINIYRDSF
ncbi:hypothetical protein IFR04_014933 [Cadophora malorum]|uniref:Uncharacterized protein n=1 Tax=Cadophora malorum TaxID=108018 RepID=A0A8H7T3U2_9HELO|nr:hypothetical protein IFR04_014933 [Cadophora malorum]